MVDKIEILRSSKILYCMYGKPMTETCMCWGLDVPDAWLPEVDEMSKKLEGANILASKYRVRIQMDQVKDKYATLHAYHSICCDPPKLVLLYESLVQRIVAILGKFDYRCKEVIDHEPYDEVIVEEVPKDKYEHEVELCKNISNVEVLVDESGKCIKRTTLHHYRQTHYEPTRLKFAYRIWKRQYVLLGLLRKILRWKPSHKQQCIAKMLDEYASRTIANAVEECEHKCERCGKHIYDDDKYSPRCTTQGWVSYLCKECADKSNSRYVCRDEVWQNGKVIVNKEDYAKMKSDFHASVKAHSKR